MYTAFLRLSDAIGPVPALVFCAFASAAKTFYVPETYIAGHILERLLGEDSFLKMIANFGGETIMIPAMRLDEIRHLGLVYRMSKRGYTAQQIEQGSGLAYRNIRLIQAKIKSGRPLTKLATKAPDSR